MFNKMDTIDTIIKRKMVDYSVLDNLYKLYGYDVKDYDGIRVYEFKHGRYFGADIFGDDKHSSQVEEILQMYQSQSFATSLKKNQTIEEVESELFASFFHVAAYKRMLRQQYNIYKEKIESRLSNNFEYSYVSGKYRNSIFKVGDNETLALSDYDGRGDIITRIEDGFSTYATYPQLTIIEAAAGFGKTCTAYEILKSFYSSEQDIIPLYIELSRNREARIFKHILQNEIEKQFQNIVTSDLVLHEIKQGKIPVIIDGFDELLSKDFETDAHNLRDIESMLSTILDLLENRAKVIITSRKTAIFSGEDFYNSILRADRHFVLQRIALESPELNDWLTADQLELSKKCDDFKLEQVANPVLLSYVRSLSLDEFKNILNKEVSIVDVYFKSLLDREQSRQALYMDEEQQKRVLRKLVRFMCEFDIKADSKAFIKELFLDYNNRIFSDYIEKCILNPKPTHEDLAETFSNHALLDRNNENQVGFINDFIFGVLIAENIVLRKFIEHYPDTYRHVLSQTFAELAVESYRIMPLDERSKLWNSIDAGGYSYDDRFFFLSDVYLTDRLHRSEYKNILLESIEVKNVIFDGTLFTNVIFSRMTFRNCEFKCSILKESGFVDCSFYDCSWIPESIQEPTPYLLGCDCNNDFINDLYADNVPSTSFEVSESEKIEQIILSMFIRTEGRVAGMRRMQTIRSECKGFSEHAVSKVLNSMKNNHYIIVNGGNCFIQQEGISYYTKNYVRRN